jgi:Tfp pilus assembly protein PilX
MGKTQLRSERGMVSILVTMIMMIVITLIIIGISQVTRSNRREQLDQQLSAQAYYAAESGLNQATKFFAANPLAKLNTNGNCTTFITSPNSGPNPTGLGQVSGMLNASTNVSYTCLMVNSTPASLQKSPLTQDSNTVWKVQNASGAAFTQLEFKWASSANSQFASSNTCTAAAGSANNFKQYGNWNCTFGILRVDLVSTAGTVSSATLESPAKTIYMVPTFSATGNPSGTPVGVTSGAGQVVYVKCDATTGCDLKLTPLAASSEYFVRISMMYQDSDSVQLSGADASGPKTSCAEYRHVSRSPWVPRPYQLLHCNLPTTCASRCP